MVTTTQTVTLTFQSGATREVDQNIADVVVGLDPEGRILVDQFDGEFLFGLTLCCDASDKGLSDAIVCRGCYGEAETGAYYFAQDGVLPAPHDPLRK